MRKFLLLLFCYLLFEGLSYAQNKFRVTIISDDVSYSGKRHFEVKDSLTVLKHLSLILNDLHSKGYLAASFDSVSFRKGSVDVSIFCGDKYEWISLRKGNVPEEYLVQSGFRERFFVNKPFQPVELAKIEKSIVHEAENSGYPFAKIFLDSITIVGTEVSGKLNYVAGPLYTFDTLFIEGPVKIKNSYLMRHLRLSEGEPFSQEKFENISSLLKKLPFLQEARPAGLEFFGDKAKVVLYLKPRKVNQIDIVAGLIPNQGKENKTILTGEANLVLQNLFNSGKRISGQWRRFDVSSQLLELGYFHPKTFGTFLDLSTSFDLLKQDSSFINVNRDITLSQQSPGGKIFIGIGRKTSRKLGITSSDFADYNFTSYAIGFSKENMDNYLFPRSGWILSGETKVGNKKILNKEKLSDDIPEQSLQIVFTCKGAGYFKLGRRVSAVSSIYAAGLVNKRSALFVNDLFRVGGLKTLRGFNENLFYAASFAVATAEFRLYPDDETYLFLFYDHGYIFNPLSIIRKEDTPFGTGAGISFSSNAGIFNFAWSLGKSSVQPLTFNNSKIHFGYITRF